MTRRTTLSLLTGAAVLALASLVPAARAADEAANVTGTWKWSNEFQGNTVETTLKLKQDGSKLTGTITGRGGQETAISEGKVTGDEVSFQVTRERNGNTFTQKYHGKLSGDAITGKIEMMFGDQSRERDWTAKKVSG